MEMEGLDSEVSKAARDLAAKIESAQKESQEEEAMQFKPIKEKTNDDDLNEAEEEAKATMEASYLQILFH